MEPFLQPPLLAEEGGGEVGDSSTTTTTPPNAMATTPDMTIESETSLPDEHHQQQQEEMSSRIPLDPAMASSSPLPSPSVRHTLHHHHRRQPTGFHEKQLGDDTRRRYDITHETTSHTTMNALSGRRSITLRLLEEITPPPTPAPTPLRQSPLLLRRFRSMSLSR
jgi:hypothetical protein